MKIYKFFLLVILSMHLNFSTAFADPPSSGYYNDATKPVNVDYKRGYDEI